MTVFVFRVTPSRDRLERNRFHGEFQPQHTKKKKNEAEDEKNRGRPVYSPPRAKAARDKKAAAPQQNAANRETCTQATIKKKNSNTLLPSAKS